MFYIFLTEWEIAFKTVVVLAWGIWGVIPHRHIQVAS